MKQRALLAIANSFCINALFLQASDYVLKTVRLNPYDESEVQVLAIAEVTEKLYGRALSYLEKW